MPTHDQGGPGRGTPRGSNQNNQRSGPPRNPDTGEGLICPPPEPPVIEAIETEEVVDLRTEVEIVSRAHLAGQFRTMVDSSTYVELPEGYFMPNPDSGFGQEVTPYKQENLASPYYGKSWQNLSPTATDPADRFRFVMNGFWTKTKEEHFVYASGLGARRPFLINRYDEMPRGLNDGDLGRNFDGPFYDMDREFGQKSRIRLTLQVRDFTVPPSQDWLENVLQFTGLDDSGRYPPLLDEGKVFKDHAFKISVPLSERKVEKLGSINRPNIEKHSSEYNFYDEKYESAITGQSSEITLFPNLYVFLAEKNSTNRSGFYNEDNYWIPEGGSAYDRHITLGGEIRQVFMDVLNERGEKIGEKDRGQYFSKWSKAFALVRNAIGQDRIDDPFVDLKDKFKNIIFSLPEMSLLTAYNDKRFLFPMYTDIEFMTDTRTEVAEAIRQAELNTSLVRGFLTRREQQLDQNQQSSPPWSRNANFTISTEAYFRRTSDRNEGTIELQEDIKLDQSVDLMDLMAWWEKFLVEGNGIYSDITKYVSIHTGQEELFQDPDNDNEFIRIINSLIFSGRITDICQNKFRTFDQILNGKMAESETLFYKIEKYKISQTLANAGTPDPNPVLVQRIFIPNSNEIDVLRYIDTQVAYEEEMLYKVSAVELVYGSEYKYTDVNWSGIFLEADVFVRPSLQVIEIPYFEFQSRIADRPPLAPEINIVPFKGIDDQILLNFSAQTGRSVAQPISLNQTEKLRETAIRRSQGLRPGEPVIFRGDDEIDYYEIFRMRKKPVNYQEFDNNLHAVSDSEFYGSKNLRSSSTSYIDFLNPNTKYYYMFRAVDIHQNKSNPSAVYEVEIINTDGAIYHSISAVEFEAPPPPPKSRSFDRFLRISPTLEQEEVVITNEERPETAHNAQIKLGAAEENLFVSQTSKPKKYKFRVISKQTGKKIDLNLTFKHEHISDTDA